MAKRAWAELNAGTDTRDMPQADTGISQSSPTRTDQQSQGRATVGDAEAQSDTNPHSTNQCIPQLSRKIKACTSCRKHKIKCVIGETGPPCRHCAKHNLGCTISRNLQTVIDEKTQYSEAIFRDLENIHSTLREVTRSQGLPEPRILQTTAFRNSGLLWTGGASTNFHDGIDEPNGNTTNEGEGGLTRDASPEISAQASPDYDSNLPHVPIQSLYALTKLKALRSPDNALSDQDSGVDDFIARGAIRWENAERLFLMYRNRLDAFMYCVGCPYQSLNQLRSKSPVLTTAILAVAALHEPQANALYSICNNEFRRLIQQSMFYRSVDRDYLRALCVVSYWLTDMSWMLSGYATRRALEYELHNQLSRSTKDPQSEDAVDGTRLWFILQISDQRLATLYGRPSIVHEYPSMDEVERYLEGTATNTQDRRLMSQVALQSIFKGIRELFGPDHGQPVPRAYLNDISHFNKQLDRWYNHWSGVVAEEYVHIGRFPRKAASLHYYFAKLHLYSHVFRGLSSHDSIPHYFLDCTAAAISAAISTIELILTDPEVTALVAGLPTYLHCMTAFACMFLIQAAHKYGKDLLDPEYAWDLTTRLVRHFRSVSASKWHLTQLMTPRLERMAAVLDPTLQAAIDPTTADMPLATPAYSKQHRTIAGSGHEAAASSIMELQPDHSFDYHLNFGIPDMTPFSGPVYGAEGLPF